MSESVVTSSQNAQLKLVRKLQRRRARDVERAFVVEGEDLVLAGLETGAAARVLLVDAERVPEIDPALVSCPIMQVESALLASVSAMPHPPRVIGVFEQPSERRFADGVSDGRGPWVALAGLADPGNVGTVVRAAAAFGAGGVLTLPGTADPFSGKAARASMGAVFRTPIVRVDGSQVDAVQALADVRVVALDASGSVDLWDAPLDSRTIVVAGSERDGVDQALLEAADVIARIPQDPRVESVNAGVAASIALYEWRRRQGAEAR